MSPNNKMSLVFQKLSLFKRLRVTKMRAFTLKPLPKLPIITKNASNKSCSELNSIQKTLAQQSCARKPGFLYLLKQQFSFIVKHKY